MEDLTGLKLLKVTGFYKSTEEREISNIASCLKTSINCNFTLENSYIIIADWVECRMVVRHCSKLIQSLYGIYTVIIPIL
jgi:hypothetical protein